MIRIRLSYDKSIEAFFEMFQFLVNFNIITALGFAYILAMHFFDYHGGLFDL
jgi:predicted cobalt transporter CbtA